MILCRVSRPKELPLWPLAEPYVNLSTHATPIKVRCQVIEEFFEHHLPAHIKSIINFATIKPEKDSL